MGNKIRDDFHLKKEFGRTVKFRPTQQQCQPKRGRGKSNQLPMPIGTLLQLLLPLGSRKCFFPSIDKLNY